jgi:hypothetical protein
MIIGLHRFSPLPSDKYKVFIIKNIGNLAHKSLSFIQIEINN